MYIIAVHTIAMYIIAMHTIAIALCIKCTYLIAVHIALRPTHQESSRLAPGQLKDRYVRQKLYQLKVQWSKIAMSARNYITSKFKGQISLCPPETISAQSSKGKCRYVRQKLCQLKAQWSNVAMSTRNYISSKFKGHVNPNLHGALLVTPKVIE